MVAIVFLVAAVIAVVFSVLTIALRNPVMNVLSLVVVFFAMAAIFAILGMDFLAAIQVIVYSGAILVLFLFVIMLLNIRHAEGLGGGGHKLQTLFGALAAIGLGAAIVYAVSLLSPAATATLPGAVEQGTARAIGLALLSSHLLAFEFITLVLVAAIVGAVYLARREPR